MSQSGPSPDPLAPTRVVRGPSADVRSELASPAPVALELPQVPGYEIEGILGRGGMGIVYKARHRALDRTVALKMLLAGQHADPVEVARFNFEAQALARVRHPNIVTVHEVGWHRGQPFMALEYVEGGTLGDRLQGRPLPPRQAAEIVLVLARALDGVHRQGLIHRDLKPSNIFLQSAGPGSPLVLKIGDFGLARPIGQNQQVTRTGFVVGTPEYMAPEQLIAQSDQVGPATDVYSLGVILFQLLAGRRPFEAPGSLEIFQQVRDDEPPAPSRFSQRPGRDLDVICLKCLQKEPARRYSSAGELAEDLDRFLTNRPILARPVGWPERLVKWARRRPAVASLLVSLLLVTLLGFAGVMTQWRLAERRATAEIQARGEADRQTARAEDHRRRAEEAVTSEKRERSRAEMALYAGHMVLAHREFETGNALAARELLERYRDLHERRKDWEWRYLDRATTNHVSSAELVPYRWPWQIAFHPNGEIVALAFGGTPGEQERGQGGIRLWHLPSGKITATIGIGGPTRQSVAFSPDGKELVSQGLDGKLQVWDLDQGRLTHELPAGTLDRHAIAPEFTAESKAILLQHREVEYDREGKLIKHVGLVQRVELNTGQRRDLPGKFLLGVARKGQVCAVHDGAGQVQVVDTARGTVTHKLTVQASLLAISPDGELLASWHDFAVQVWQIRSGQRVALLPHSSAVICARFSPDGLFLATGATDTIVRVFNLSRPNEPRLYRGHGSGLRTLAFHPEGRLLVSADVEARILCWDLSRSQASDWFDSRAALGPVLGEHYAAMAFNATGDRLILPHNDARGVVLDVASGQRAAIWDVDSRGEDGRGVNEQALTIDGSRLVALARSDPRRVHLWDLSPDGTPRSRQPRILPGHDQQVHRVALSGDGKRVATVSNLGPVGEVKLWNAETGELLRTGRGLPCFNLALSQDGRYLALAELGGSLRLLDMSTGEQLPAPSVKESAIFALTFAPNSPRLAWGGLLEGRVRIWDVQRGKETLEEPLRGPARLTGLAFNPAGTRLAAVGWNGVVHLWDSATGQGLLTLRENHAPRIDNYQYTARVVFSADGTRLAVIHWNGTVTVYDTRPPVRDEVERRYEAWQRRCAEERQALFRKMEK